MSNNFEYYKRGQCPVCCGGAKKGQTCRRNMATNIVHCRAGVGDIEDYIYLKDDAHGFGMYQLRVDREEWTQEKREDWEKQREEERQLKSQQRKADIDRRASKLLSPEEIDLEIRHILGQLELRPLDRQRIIDRGFTNDEIDRYLFRSVSKYQELTAKASPNLPGVNGAGTKLNNRTEGILIAPRDADGRFTGLRVHNPNHATNDSPKYYPLTSSKNDRDLTSHLPNGELPIDVTIPEDWNGSNRIYLVEGIELKGKLAAKRLKSPVIATPGNIFGGSPETTKQAISTIQAQLGIDKPEIVIVPDGGMTDGEHESVINGYRSGWELAKGLGLQTSVLWWGQTTKQGNDIDEISLERLTKAEYWLVEEFVKFAEERQDEDDENTQTLQIKLGNLLEIKGKKAPQIFKGELGESLLSTANNFNIPSEILVFCLLPILSARIPSETRLLINPGTDYSVPALRWNALIGETGTKKSPVLKALLAPLLSIQKQISAKYKEQKDIYDKEYSLWKSQKVNEREEEPTPPAPMLDCYFSDFTIESIGQSISDRPDDSYLVFVDELAGFFKSMDAYRKSGGDRQKWLDIYNASALKINRKGSPTVFCPHTSVSILGGLQPSVLEQMIKDDPSAEDGLWNRFMFCRLPQTKTEAFSHNSISLFTCLLSLYQNLSSAKPTEHTLSEAAKSLWKAWHDGIEDKVMSETSELLRGTYAKAEGVAGRNALIVHRAIAAQQETTPDRAISGDVMAMAIEWTQWELGQTLLEYQRLGLTEDPELSRILRFIDKFEGKGWVNAVAVRPWWSGKVKPPVRDIRSFMTKVVTLGYAIDNGESPTSGKYQILIDRKGSHVSHVSPKDDSQQGINHMTTLSHKISQSGDEAATQSHFQNMTNGSHKISHVLDDDPNSGTEIANPERNSQNMTNFMTKGSHLSKPTELRHPIDSHDENMTKGSHVSKASLADDYSEKVTNMTTFSSDENTIELANLESIAETLRDLARLPEDEAIEGLDDLYQVWKAEDMTKASSLLKAMNPVAFDRVTELARNRKSLRRLR
jgi:Protein of unknown function (DUF3987)